MVKPWPVGLVKTIQSVVKSRVIWWTSRGDLAHPFWWKPCTRGVLFVGFWGIIISPLRWQKIFICRHKSTFMWLPPNGFKSMILLWSIWWQCKSTSKWLLSSIDVWEDFLLLKNPFEQELLGMREEGGIPFEVFFCVGGY